jgi:hypothetical protein
MSHTPLIWEWRFNSCVNCRWLVVDSSSIWKCKSWRFRTFQSESLFFQRRVGSTITFHSLFFTLSHSSNFTDLTLQINTFCTNYWYFFVYFVFFECKMCYVDFKRGFQDRLIHCWSTMKKMGVHHWSFMLLAMVPLKLSSTNWTI